MDILNEFNSNYLELAEKKVDYESLVDVERINHWKDVLKVKSAGSLSYAFPNSDPEDILRWINYQSKISKENEFDEPILQEEINRDTLFPLKDKEMWEFRKLIERLHWIAQEVVLDNDHLDLKKVTEGDKKLLFNTLGFFGVADDIIMEGIDSMVSDRLKVKEAQFYLQAQMNQECVHSESYSLQIQAIVPQHLQDDIFNSIRTHPIVGKMSDWVNWWIYGHHTAADIFTLMACLEGILFSGFFAILQFYKVRNLFPGVTSLNEFISRDENAHTQFWCFLISKRLKYKPDIKVVHGIVNETVNLSSMFFEHAIPDDITGINAKLLSQYVRYTADTVLNMMGFDDLYNDTNPFDFMDMLALNQVSKSNFFEHKPTQYQAPHNERALEFTVVQEVLEKIKE